MQSKLDVFKFNTWGFQKNNFNEINTCKNLTWIYVIDHVCHFTELRIIFR